MTYSN